METMTVAGSKPKAIECHYYQTQALKSEARFVALIAGTGGGKTYTGPMWLYQELEKYPTDEFLVIAPTYKMLTRATVPTMIDIFRGTPAEGVLKQSHGVYITPHGARIWLGSADRPESLEAGQYRGAWIDEAGQIKFQAWYVVQARLGVKEGRALITTTPYAVNWLYYEFYKRWLDGDTDYDVVQFASISNPYYPQAEFERAKRTLSPELFEMRYGGQFRKMEGLIYPEFGADHIVDFFSLPEDWKNLGWRKHGGIDFGYNNPFVSLKAALSPDDVLWIYDEYYKSNTLLDEHANRIIDTDIRYEADPSGKREIVELKHKGVKIRSANNEVNPGIDAVRARIRTQRLRIVKICRNLIDEFETYAWTEDKDKPQKERDHCFDDKTEMLTENGWKYFKDLNRSERVATLSPNWGLTWQRPTAYQQYTHKGDLFTYDGLLNFAVTPEHNMLVVSQYDAKKSKTHKLKLKKISEIIKVRATLKNRGKRNQSSQWWIPLVSKPEIKKPLDKIDGYFLGFWLAEGCKSISRGRKYVHIDNQRESLLLKAVANVSPSSKSCKNNNCKRISIRDDKLYDLLPKQRSWEKRIPRWFLEWAGYDELYACYQGMMDGDGCYQRHGSHYDTVSKGLADDFQELLIRIGKKGTLRQIEVAGVRSILGKQHQCRAVYRITIKTDKSNYYILSSNRIKIMPYNGKVYCVTVPNHNVYIRREGRTMWIGQCLDALRYMVMGIDGRLARPRIRRIG